MSQSNDPRKVRFHVFEDERFVDLNLYQFGWERCTPLYSFGPYVRNHYLFHYVIQGKGVLIANDQQYPVQAGQGFLICPKQVTSYMADETDPWEYTWLEFDGLWVKESLTLAGIGIKNPIWQAVSHEAAELLQKQMLCIVDLAEQARPSQRCDRQVRTHPLQILGHGFLFLDQLIQSSAHRDDSTDKRLRNFYIKEALSFLEQNYQQDISVEEIAAVCGLNRSYFGRIFKESMGESPQQFLIHYRMAKAAQLLKASKLPISKIGTMVNYPNQLHFSRAFKTIYGIAPREYRQRHFITDSMT